VLVLVSGRVRRGLVNVGTCTARFSLCRYVFGEVSLVPGRQRRGRVIVGTFSAKSGRSWDVFGDVGLV